MTNINILFNIIAIVLSLYVCSRCRKTIEFYTILLDDVTEARDKIIDNLSEDNDKIDNMSPTKFQEIVNTQALVVAGRYQKIIKDNTIFFMINIFNIGFSVILLIYNIHMSNMYYYLGLLLFKINTKIAGI